MIYGIALLGNRVSPRCACADSILFVLQNKDIVRSRKLVPVSNLTLSDLCEILQQNRTDTLVCGGITKDGKDLLSAQHISIIDNVACTKDCLIEAMQSGKLRHNYGFDDIGYDSAPKQCETGNQNDQSAIPENTSMAEADNAPQIDCLACTKKVCLDGKACEASCIPFSDAGNMESECIQMLDAATDISDEKERTLCRLSELIYFCLEMQYEKLGVAYCVELDDATDVLVRVLRRFFKVYPVCCKVGGQSPLAPENAEMDGENKKHYGSIPCNPLGQAQVLNHIKTDFNIMVGLCMGVDCIFAKESQAPSSALFIKDRSLANNPIGAIYSEYYLKEAAQAHS